MESKATGEKTLYVALPTELHGIASNGRNRTGDTRLMMRSKSHLRHLLIICEATGEEVF